MSHAVVDHSAIKGDNIELWAIRVPPGFDATQLDGLELNSASGIVSGDGFDLRDAPAVECEHILPAFPSAKRKRWVLAKPFARQLVVSIAPPPVSTAAQGVPPPLPPVPMASGLRLRSTFLGGTLPPRTAPLSARRRKPEGDASGQQATPASSDREDAESKAARKAARKAAKRAAR